MACENHPRQDVTAYATLGGHQCPTGYTVGGIPLRIEIVGACHEEFGIYSAILANCIFHMMKSHVSIFPGAIYKDVIAVLDDSFHMQHILLIPPFYGIIFQRLNYLIKSNVPAGRSDFRK